MSKRKRDILIYLEDIAESSGLVISYIEDISESEFYKHPEKQDAVIRRITIIGEAVKHIPEAYREKWNHIPWKELAGMRDIVVHEYFGITLAMVWKLAVEDIPVLKNQVDEIILKETTSTSRQLTTDNNDNNDNNNNNDNNDNTLTARL